MRIDWLNDDLTEARVTRGFWWWKKQATITRVASGGLRSCRHPEFVDGNRERAGMMCTLCCAVFGNLDDTPAWKPVRSLPAAKVVRR